MQWLYKGFIEVLPTLYLLNTHSKGASWSHGQTNDLTKQIVKAEIGASYVRCRFVALDEHSDYAHLFEVQIIAEEENSLRLTMARSDH